MAKDKGEPTVEVPVSVLERLQARVDALERTAAVAAEKADGLHEKQVYDAAWEAKAKDASRTAAERTQDACDRLYGVKAPRWRVRIDGTREGGGRPINVGEHPAVVVSANSEEEATGRYAKLCGVRGFLDSDLKYRAERADAPEPAAA